MKPRTGRDGRRNGPDWMQRVQHGDEAGVALAVSLVLIVVVGMIAAAGFGLSNFELDTSRDFRAGTEAFYLADRGLNRYLAQDAPDLVSSVSYSFQKGSATVTRERIVLGMDDHEELHRVRSTGTYQAPGGETVQRTVSTVILATPLMPVFPTGAFVSGGKLNQNGTSALFDGTDGYTGGDAQCTAAGIGGSGVSGIVADSFEVAGGGGGGACDNSGTVLPTPPGAECRSDALSEFMTADQWQALEDLPADHSVVDGEPFPQTSGFEVVKVEGGSYSLDSGSRNGQGILIVDGDFRTNGNFEWEGLVLVGGKLAASNGTETIEGGFVTGLDELLGQNVPTTNVGNGNKTFKYNSCNVYKASTSRYRVTRVPSSLYQPS